MPIPATWSPKLLSVLRIVVGLAFIDHGISKFFNIPPFPGQMTTLLTVAGCLEVGGGALILIGLFTRPVAFVLSGFCAVAYFMVHFPLGLLPLANGGEPAMLYCFIFLYFSAAGGGAWSADASRGAP
jgi:putative oxidoreductase